MAPKQKLSKPPGGWSKKPAADSKGDSKTREQDAVLEKFKQFDLNGDGKITLAELSKVLTKLDPQRWTYATVQRLFSEIDVDKSKCLNVEEFIDFVFRMKTGPTQAVSEMTQKIQGQEASPRPITSASVTPRSGPARPESHPVDPAACAKLSKSFSAKQFSKYWDEVLDRNTQLGNEAELVCAAFAISMHLASLASGGGEQKVFRVLPTERDGTCRIKVAKKDVTFPRKYLLDFFEEAWLVMVKDDTLGKRIADVLSVIGAEPDLLRQALEGAGLAEESDRRLGELALLLASLRRCWPLENADRARQGPVLEFMINWLFSCVRPLLSASSYEAAVEELKAAAQDVKLGVRGSVAAGGARLTPSKTWPPATRSESKGA
eukprot:TRINITY_DN27965_c0_g1_i1.p1 TRINITY_DN27965_c0_g1~~TRINITY_DN27965_c0_g1_i1.p1  ORF type:complete len:377 (-),score=89.18 TRINITY_DN27965_c0_g1_i1:327-1457(-)